MFLWFGAIGVAGNVVVSRTIDRIGTARAVTWLLGAIALSLLLWPLGRTLVWMALVMTPWAFGCFASNSAPQARFLAAPVLAPALIALNSSAMYVGQALGASSGGVMVAEFGFGPLHWVALAWMVAAIGLSRWAQRRLLVQSASGSGHG